MTDEEIYKLAVKLEAESEKLAEKLGIFLITEMDNAPDQRSPIELSGVTAQALGKASLKLAECIAITLKKPSLLDDLLKLTADVVSKNLDSARIRVKTLIEINEKHNGDIMSTLKEARETRPELGIRTDEEVEEFKK